MTYVENDVGVATVETSVIVCGPGFHLEFLQTQNKNNASTWELIRIPTKVWVKLLTKVWVKLLTKMWVKLRTKVGVKLLTKVGGENPN